MAGIGLSLGLVVGAGLLACNVALRWPRDRGQALMDGACATLLAALAAAFIVT